MGFGFSKRIVHIIEFALCVRKPLSFQLFTWILLLLHSSFNGYASNTSAVPIATGDTDKWDRHTDADRDTEDCCRPNNNQTRVCLNSSYWVVREGFEWVENMFHVLTTNKRNYITSEELSMFMKQIKLLQTSRTHDDHQDYDHDTHDDAHKEHHEKEHAHEEQYEEEHAHEEQHKDEHALDHHKGERVDEEQHELNETTNGNVEATGQQCLKSVDDILEAYYPDKAHAEIKISLSDFLMIIPRLLHDIRLGCHIQSAVAGGHADDDEEESAWKIWLIALVSVAVISMLSLVGVVILPLMRHKSSFNRLLSLLIALGVGTLVGDALMHLLPHALESGPHDHEDQGKIIKSFVAVLGIYAFFILECTMMIWRSKKQKRAANDRSENGMNPFGTQNGVATPAGVTDGASRPVTGNGSVHHRLPQIRTDKRNKYHDVSGASNEITPPFPLGLHLCDCRKDDEGGRLVDSCSSEESEYKRVATHANHDHLHHDPHDHGNMVAAKTVKDMAWIVIAGDGLHNFTDGLAIGAAFTGSISAGLSTSLAIFFHELPHEFGDFAILIDAGMTIKKALIYNGMSACIAFVGAIIGIIVGEYVESVKLWILAITAGGFLYVALVDMMPEIKSQCTESDGITRFFFQNVGFLCGVAIMFVIAYYEEAFSDLFNVSHGH